MCVSLRESAWVCVRVSVCISLLRVFSYIYQSSRYNRMLFILHSCTAQHTQRMYVYHDGTGITNTTVAATARTVSSCVIYPNESINITFSVIERLSTVGRLVGRWFFTLRQCIILYIKQNIFTHTNKRTHRIKYTEFIIKETEAQLNSDNNNVDDGDDNKKEEKQTNKTHPLV